MDSIDRQTERSIHTAWCFFEQSGTFKNQFKKLGIEAYDLDILNDYGETDFQIDLFDEIQKGYKGEPSIFDRITQDDLIMAFFPCTRFQECNYLLLKGKANQQRRSSIERRLEYSMNLHKELNKHFTLITQMALLAMNKGLRMVIENPYTQPHYLTEFWALEPAVIDKDRRMNGDHFKKPTQFWFIGFEPKQNLVFEPIEYVETKNVKRLKGGDRQKARSMIHPQYANRFIRQYLI